MNTPFHNWPYDKTFGAIAAATSAASNISISVEKFAESFGEFTPANHVTLLGEALGKCLVAAGIVRADAQLTGPQLLLFSDDLEQMLKQAEAIASSRDDQSARAQALEEALRRISKMSRSDGPWDQIAHDMQQIADRALSSQPVADKKTDEFVAYRFKHRNDGPHMWEYYPLPAGKSDNGDFVTQALTLKKLLAILNSDQHADRQSQPVADGSTAARDVLTERRRQVETEGWTPEHDDSHSNGEIARAASCYITAKERTHLPTVPLKWPWSDAWWKPDGYRRNLVKAGALILAEIERLDRLPASQGASE